jgi:hypothetical protein
MTELEAMLEELADLARILEHGTRKALGLNVLRPNGKSETYTILHLQEVGALALLILVQLGYAGLAIEERR